MINKQKSKFNDRIHNKSNKDISFKGIYGEKHHKNVKSQLFNIISQEVNQKDQHLEESSIVKKLEKHVAFLQKKLEDSQYEIGELNRFIQAIKERLGQKDLESNYLQKQLEKYQEFTQKMIRKSQLLQSELQNSKLRSKMDNIYQQVKQQKETLYKATLKHQVHKKGMFSSFSVANLSSEKNSPLQKTPNIQQRQTISKHQKPIVNKSQLQNPLNEYLMQEWQRTKQQNNDKQLQNTALQNKIVLLKKQIAKQSRQLQILKSEKRQANQLAIALEKLRQNERQYKILLMKFRDCQKKKNELTKYLKSKNDSTGQSRIYRTSVQDINDLIYKISKGLQIQRNIFDVTILVNKTKKEATTQTSQSYQNQQHAQQKKSSELLIKKLSEKIVQKQEQFKRQLDKTKQRYEEELKEYSNEIEQNRLQIQQLNLMIQKHEKEQDTFELQKLLNTKEYKHVNVQCNIISNHLYEEQQDILKKVQILIDHNQALEIQNQKMKQEIRIYSMRGNVLTCDRYTQNEDTFIREINQMQFLQKNEEISIVNRYMQENIKLKKDILSITTQKQHFHNEYSLLEAQLGKTQQQLQKHVEIDKARQQELNIISRQLQDKNIEIQRYKAEMVQIQQKLKSLQDINGDSSYN